MPEKYVWLALAILLVSAVVILLVDSVTVRVLLSIIAFACATVLVVDMLRHLVQLLKDVNNAKH